MSQPRTVHVLAVELPEGSPTDPVIIRYKGQHYQTTRGQYRDWAGYQLSTAALVAQATPVSGYAADQGSEITD